MLRTRRYACFASDARISLHFHGIVTRLESTVIREHGRRIVPLENLRDLDSLRFKAHVYSHMQLSEHGVASVYIDTKTQQEFGISFEEACAAVGYLDGIRGCLCWLAFIETGDERASIRVRLRSRFMAINPLAEAYRGGGHANASGATVFGAEEVRALTAQADAMVKEYKETHEGWL